MSWQQGICNKQSKGKPEDNNLWQPIRDNGYSSYKETERTTLYEKLLAQIYTCCALIRNMESQDFTASRNHEDSGPIAISDLHNSVPNSSASKKKKKDFKRLKAHRDKAEISTAVADLNQQEPNTNSSIEEPILNRLRSRLDPTYNTTNASSHPVVVDSDSLPESSTPAVDKPVKRMKKKHRERSRDKDTNDRPTGVDLTASETQLENSATQVPLRPVES